MTYKLELNDTEAMLVWQMLNRELHDLSSRKAGCVHRGALPETIADLTWEFNAITNIKKNLEALKK